MTQVARQQRSHVADLEKTPTQLEKELRDKIHRRERISKNVHRLHRQRMTFGQRLSDRLAETAGSWRFIIGFGIFLGVWVLINTVVFVRHWDNYPYILLNLILSMLAAIQAPVIMMSQNREEARDRIRAQHDYEINLKAELEIQELHEKIDQLRESQWNELLALQKQQIDLLEAQLALLQQRTPK